MQPYVFGILGLSGQDRSILVERLVAELVRRGHRVSIIREGLTDVVPLFDHVTLVLAVGFPDSKWPKLEVYGGSGPLALQNDPWLVAVAGPSQPRGCPTPWYHWDEVTQIANVIENARSLGLAVK